MKDKITKARPLISILIILVCVGIDQLTKLLAINNLRDLADEIPVINKVFGLYYVENKGISFSMLSSKMALIIIITSIIMLILIYVMIRTPKTKYFMPFSIVLSVIVGGAAGNMIDRIFRGFVIDFIMLDFINFPIFNVADICAVLGTFMLIAIMLFLPKRVEKVW